MYRNTNHPSKISGYEPVIVPVDYNKSFLDFTGKEAHAYYNWFLSIKDQRLKQLCHFLFQDPSNCLKEDNLKTIEIFLTNSISTIPKPEKQIKKEEDDIPLHLKPFAIPNDYFLDEKTISICYDVGIYLGELMSNLDTKIKWELEIDDNSADYGQQVLSKRNIKLRLNPFRVTKNIAVTIHEGKYNESDLINVFNTWKKLYKVE